MPSPNGHDDFREAYRLYQRPAGQKYTSDLDASEMAALVETNKQALQFVEEGLAKQCRVSLHSPTNYIDRRMNELMLTKDITRVFAWRAQQARTEGQIEEALRLSLLTIRFAHESVRGGLLIDGLVGMAAEAVGIGTLESMIGELSLEQSRHALRVLQEIDAQAEPVAAVFANERWWFRTHPLKHRLAAYIQAAIHDRTLQPLTPQLKAFEGHHQGAAQRRQQLIAKVARRAREPERGPASSTRMDSE